SRRPTRCERRLLSRRIVDEPAAAPAVIVPAAGHVTGVFSMRASAFAARVLGGVAGVARWTSVWIGAYRPFAKLGLEIIGSDALSGQIAPIKVRVRAVVDGQIIVVVGRRRVPCHETAKVNSRKLQFAHGRILLLWTVGSARCSLHRPDEVERSVSGKAGRLPSVVADVSSAAVY